MTVADLSPLQLYAIVIMANVTCFLGLMGLREWPRLRTKREKLVMLAGLCAGFGLPVIMALMAMKP